MLAKVYSCAINGLDAYPVTIEVDVARGLPATIIVGLPDNAVKESKERVRSAIKNSGYAFGPKRITINLSPADTKKEGPSFDLAIAVGILAATEQIDPASLEKYVLLGELSLDGGVQPISGALSVALALTQNHYQGLLLPYLNAPEIAVSPHIPVYPVKSLKEAVYFLSNPQSIQPFQLKSSDVFQKLEPHASDFADVKGQAAVKRGLEVAAAGGHNVLLIGPPGSGKSMLAKRLPTILPDMNLEESLETTKIHSVMGLLKPGQSLLRQRPFRASHHTSSDAALVGGGSIPKPGEVTLSHNGILFLDELPEFNRNALEALRQPLEDHVVTISRATKTVCFPSKFMLVCAMNPCPCGWFTDPRKECHCSPQQVQRYISKVSGPLLDRIDIHLEVPALPSLELLSTQRTESSQSIKERVVKARARQQNRFTDSAVGSNSHMTHRQIQQYCPLGEEAKALIQKAIEELALSARAYDKILKIARTIADLADSEDIQTEHLAEAIQYRSLDRNWWG